MIGRSTAAVTIALCLIATGCGSSNGDAAKAVRDYLSAFAQGNLATPCDLLAPSARRRMARVFKSRDCPALLKKTYNRLGASVATVTAAEVRLTSSESSAARARVTLAGHREEVRLVKLPEGWKIDRIDLVASLFGLNDVTPAQ